MRKYTNSSLMINFHPNGNKHRIGDAIILCSKYLKAHKNEYPDVALIEFPIVDSFSIWENGKGDIIIKTETKLRNSKNIITETHVIKDVYSIVIHTEH